MCQDTMTLNVWALGRNWIVPSPLTIFARSTICPHASRANVPNWLSLSPRRCPLNEIHLPLRTKKSFKRHWPLRYIIILELCFLPLDSFFMNKNNYLIEIKDTRGYQNSILFLSIKRYFWLLSHTVQGICRWESVAGTDSMVHTSVHATTACG